LEETRAISAIAKMPLRMTSANIISISIFYFIFINTIKNRKTLPTKLLKLKLLLG